MPRGRRALPFAAAAGGAAAVTPRWAAQRPDYTKPDAGLPRIDGAEHSLVFEATPQTGTYSHGAQITRHAGHFHVSWNNSPFNEDSDGQRVLYSSSADGRVWSEAVDLFPSMPASQFSTPGVGLDKIHHHAAPFVTLNGRLYAVSNVRRHGGFEIYPTPAADLNTTLLRRVVHPAALSPACPGPAPPAWCNGTARWSRPALGPLLWAAPDVPRGMENASASFGVRSPDDPALGADARAELAMFRDPRRGRDYSPDSCRGGRCNEAVAREQAVYSVKGSEVDVILYRGAGGAVPAGWPGDQACADLSRCVLLSSSRDTSDPAAPWAPVTPTAIPDLGSNLNAGSMAGGGLEGTVFLVWNGVPRPTVNDTQCARVAPLRNPLTLALSPDGLVFDRVFALYNSTRPKRYCGSAKSFGPSYPKAREVVGEGPALDGIWVVYSINKEDVGVSFAPIASLAGN